MQAKRAVAELVNNITRANQALLAEEARRKEDLRAKKRRRHA
jgi:hypothetical protein